MRLILLALHCSLLTIEPAAPHSINALIDFTEAETNTLRIVDWFREHQDQFVGGSEVRNLRMVHPFTAHAVHAFIVKKIFQTKAKPMLIELRDDVVGQMAPNIITKVSRICFAFPLGKCGVYDTAFGSMAMICASTCSS